MMKHGSLFSGIGGFDLAARWCGWKNIFQVEIDDFCQKVLAKNFPNVKKYKDIKEFNGTEYKGAIDIISGGFPCQPFSIAGKRKGAADDRSLWPEMFRIIQEIRPTWVVGENVANIKNMELDNMLASLEASGYQAQTFIIPACSSGAPHKRNRIWIIANSTCKKNTGLCKRKAKKRTKFDKQNSNATNSYSIRLERQKSIRKIQQTTSNFGYNRNEQWTENWYEVATRFCRMDDGIPNRVDRLKSLGNAIVPQIAYEIFKAIDQLEKEI